MSETPTNGTNGANGATEGNGARHLLKVRPKGWEALESLMERTGASTKVDLVQSCLVLMASLAAEQAAGKQVRILIRNDAEGREEIVRMVDLPFLS